MNWSEARRLGVALAAAAVVGSGAGCSGRAPESAPPPAARPPSAGAPVAGGGLDGVAGRVAGVLSGAGRAGTGAVPGAAQTISGFRVPEYDEQGNLKWQLLGETASVMTNGSVQVGNLRLEVFKDGRMYACITSPRCIYDRGQNVITSDDAVQIETDRMAVRGRGFVWDRAGETARIFDQAEVEFKSVTGWFTGERK